MIQSHIFLTETFLETQNLVQIVASSFFEFKFSKIELSPSFDKDKFERQILVPKIENMDDYKKYLPSLFQNYPEPTLVFLGDLSTLHESVQQGLLKLLEEPPANLFAVLFAQNQSQIIPTIKSRSRIHLLPKNIIMQNLEPQMMETVKKKLPLVADIYKLIIQKKLFELPDFKNIEREEISLWLWQLTTYLEMAYTQKPESQIALALEKTIFAQLLNSQNLQKKLVVSWLNC
jgi:hypothetical protein